MNINFAHLDRWWFLALIFLFAAAIITRSYFGVGNRIEKKTRIFLISLRTSLVGILLLILLGPSTIERREILQKQNLLLLADSSESMSIGSRPTLLKELFSKKPNNLISRLTDRFSLHSYTFSDTFRKIQTQHEKFEITGKTTNLSGSISSLYERWRDVPLAGIVVATDGLHNFSTFDVDKLEKVEVPIYTLGIPSGLSRNELEILKVEAKPIAQVGRELKIGVVVRQQGYDGKKIRLLLKNETENQVISSKLIVLKNSSDQNVEFTLKPENEGIFRYSVFSATLPNESIAENNEKKFNLKVVKTKLRIFYVEGRLRWEYTFLRRALERSSEFEADCTILTDRGRTLPNMPKFPIDEAQLLDYDLIIIGDVMPKWFTSAQQRAIVDFVEKHRRSIIFLGGKNSLGVNGFQGTPIGELLPIVIPEGGCSDRDEAIALAPTSGALHHPLMNFSNNSIKIKLLPTIDRWFGRFELRSGAIVLAESADRQSKPIIIFQRIGGGKSLLIAGEGLWNWAFGVQNLRANDESYQHFWEQAIQGLTKPSIAQPIYLATDRSNYLLGDEVHISVELHDKSLDLPSAKSATPRIDIEVLSPDGKKFKLPLSRRNAQFRANIPGVYKLTARLSSENGGKLIGEDLMEVIVEATNLELTGGRLDENTLRQISGKTGGIYLPIGEAMKLLEVLPSGEVKSVETQERKLWARPILFMFLIFLLSFEWFLRKRNNLV